MLVVERARPGSAAGHGHEPGGRGGGRGEGGGAGRDGGISQGISGISPRGGLVNCSLGRPERRGRGSERERGGRGGGGGGRVDASVWVCQVGGHRSGFCGGNERKTNEPRARAWTQITAELRT
jgi:hypothetical protein